MKTLFFVVSTAAILTAGLIILLGNLYITGIYKSESQFKLVIYSEPFRTIFGIILILAGIALLMIIHKRIHPRFYILKLGLGISVSMLIALTCVFLSEFLRFDMNTGEITRTILNRDKKIMELDMNQDNILVRPQYKSRFLWEINGKQVKLPRLPIPLEESELRNTCTKFGSPDF